MLYILNCQRKSRVLQKKSMERSKCNISLGAGTAIQQVKNKVTRIGATVQGVKMPSAVPASHRSIGVSPEREWEKEKKKFFTYRFTAQMTLTERTEPSHRL